MTTPSYNLLDEPWLPVRLGSGESICVGLMDAFLRSDEIVALADTSPPTLVAHYRLLVAILRRALCFGRHEGWTIEEGAEWYRSGIPLQRVRAYLEHWRDRFWLFHPEVPFMQVAALASAEETRDKVKPWTQISLASASGNTALVFDHSRDDEPLEVPPDIVLNHLLGYLQFTPGGLVKAIRDSDKAGPLANTAAVIPLGESLAQTLILCLSPASSKQLFADIPAWECPPLAVDDLRREALVAAGTNDRYTRQTRAVLLMQEPDGGVKWLRFAAGVALMEDESAPDPMAAYRQGSNSLVRLAFSEGRAIWRDLPALLPHPQGSGRASSSLMHALTLHEELGGIVPAYQPVLIAGLTSDQAKLERWRAEQLVLPAPLLRNPDKVQALTERLERAEKFFYDLRGLEISVLASTLPDPERKDTRNRARAILDRSPFTATYFSAADAAVTRLIENISAGRIREADDDWNKSLRRAAEMCWHLAISNTGRSGKVLLKIAPFFSRFNALLGKQLPVSEFSN